MAGSWRDRRFPARSPASFRFRPSSSLFYSILVLLSIFAVALFLSQRQISAVDRDPFSHTTHFQASKEQLWGSSLGYGYHPCVKPTSRYSVPQDSDRYITVRSNGGLNQMRTGISDMVAVARLMNATLVIPQLDKRSFWQDSSTFEDIFDEAYFIESLKGDVQVVRGLPKELESVPRARKHFTSWSGAGYYEEMAQLFKDFKVIHVPKSDSRLANNNLPLDIQRLRCRTLYQALRFATPIETLGKVLSRVKSLTGQKLVAQLRSKGRYIALHLRYEKDMLSFTGCTYGLTNQEAEELKVMRQNTNHWKLKDINSMEQRYGGLCPLTPKEVGIFLKALGYLKSTWIYLAAGEIYGGDAYIADLRSRFPNLVTKEMLVQRKELEKFTKHASQAAALDYIISVESDVFVPSYTGNMARAVEGHRRFLGHRKTINPDRKGLVELFDLIEKGEMKEGPQLSSLVSQMHKYRQGTPRKRYGSLPGSKGRARLRTEESFYENPLPECICLTKKH